MCKICDALSLYDDMTKSEYIETVRQLIRLEEVGKIRLLKGTCDFAEIGAEEQETWYADTMRQLFRCEGCGQDFMLHADTFRGAASLCVLEQA